MHVSRRCAEDMTLPVSRKPLAQRKFVECQLEILFRRRDETAYALNWFCEKSSNAARGRELNYVLDVFGASDFARRIRQVQRTAYRLVGQIEGFSEFRRSR